MIKFYRNLPLAKSLSLILAVYFLTILYYLHWIFSLEGQRLLIACLVLVLWVGTIIIRDIRLFLYHLDWIKLNSEGNCVKCLRKETFLCWDLFREVELRQAVGVGWDRAHPVHIVLSTVELTDRTRKWLCSDVDPWLFNELLIEFDLQRQEKSVEICSRLEQHSTLFSKAMKNYQNKGISISTESYSNQFDYFSLLKSAIGTCTFSLLRIMESFLWFMLVILTGYELNQPSILFKSFLSGGWTITLLLSAVLLIWRTIIKHTSV